MRQDFALLHVIALSLGDQPVRPPPPCWVYRWARRWGVPLSRACHDDAAAMQAYTLSGHGTWLSFGHKAGLRIVFGGDRPPLDVIQLVPIGLAHRGAGADRQLLDGRATPIPPRGGQEALIAFEGARVATRQ